MWRDGFFFEHETSTPIGHRTLCRSNYLKGRSVRLIFNEYSCQYLALFDSFDSDRLIQIVWLDHSTCRVFFFSSFMFSNFLFLLLLVFPRFLEIPCMSPSIDYVHEIGCSNNFRSHLFPVYWEMIHSNRLPSECLSTPQKGNRIICLPSGLQFVTFLVQNIAKSDF